MVGERMPIAGGTLIPDLLRDAPQVRPVLDRYGLRGCGGPLGPVESLEFFARAHAVELSDLLTELSAARELPKEAVVEQPSIADTIYRPFVKAGIVIALTLGAVWGAYLLLRIGFKGDFRAAGLHDINAHGHAQIFGWVGLFVMGVAYQAFPRFKHTALVGARWAIASIWLMLIGIVARSIAEPLAADMSELIPLVITASVLEFVAIGIFVAVILATWRSAARGLAFYDGYILSALVWFLIQAIYEAIYVTATLTASNREQLIDLVATWQGALRDAQIHGFAMLMILGVSQRIFPAFYGLREPRRWISASALVVLNVGIGGEMLGLILMRSAGHAWAGLWYVSALAVALAVIVLAWDWRIFGKAQFWDRNLKFLRTAYVWLFISLAMLVLLPVYQFGLLPAFAADSEATRLGFSHAYYGAIRHAITVGFVSMMIVGVAAKIVPTLNGVDLHGLRPLWLPFVLLNVGCSMRVFFQTLTDFAPAAFPIAGVSGLLEVTALAIWGVHLWGIMNGWIRANDGTTNASGWMPYRAGEAIEPKNRVGDVLDLHPELLATMINLGFRPLANPLLRSLLARRVTIEQACRQVGLKCEEVVPELNRATGYQKRSLPMVSSTH